MATQAAGASLLKLSAMVVGDRPERRFDAGENILNQGDLLLRKQDEALLEFDPLGLTLVMKEGET